MKRMIIWSCVLISLVLVFGMIVKKPYLSQDSENLLEVMTYNIDNDYKKIKKISKLIKNTGVPDLLLLQEVPGKFAVTDLAEDLGLSYFVYSNYLQDYKVGLAIISRKPLKNPKTYYFKKSFSGYAALATELIIKGQRVHVCSIHLDRVPQIRSGRQVSWHKAFKLFKREIFNKTIRSSSVEELLLWLDNFHSNYFIIGGDFNSFLHSRAIRKMNSKFNDALWPSLSYFIGTYRDIIFPFKPRIDYIFYSPNIKHLDGAVIKKGPSDHFPVKAIFDFSYPYNG